MVKSQGSDGWIGVDLDGTLAFYDGWTKWDEFGPPIPAMVERVKGWLHDGIEVRVFTARVSIGEGVVSKCYKSGQCFTNRQMKDAISAWCQRHIGERLEVTCIKDMHMIELWDDRAVGVEANTGRTLVDAAVAEANALQGKAYKP
jgi:hypothetical protein